MNFPLREFGIANRVPLYIDDMRTRCVVKGHIAFVCTDIFAIGGVEPESDLAAHIPDKPGALADANIVNDVVRLDGAAEIFIADPDAPRAPVSAFGLHRKRAIVRGRKRFPCGRRAFLVFVSGQNPQLPARRSPRAA